MLTTAALESDCACTCCASLVSEMAKGRVAATLFSSAGLEIELDIGGDEAGDQVRIVGQDAGVGRDRKQSHRGRRLVSLRASECIPRAGEEDGDGDGQAD